MTRQEIEKNVTDILVDKLGVEPEEVKNDANFEDDRRLRQSNIEGKYVVLNM